MYKKILVATDGTKLSRKAAEASHGRGGIKRVLLGSETLQVLTHSEIPVLVIR